MFALKFVRLNSFLTNKYTVVLRSRNLNLKFSHVNKINLKPNTNYLKLLNVSNIHQLSSDVIKISEAFSHLDSNYKQQLRINRNEIELLIKYIRNEDVINEDNYLLLLQCCGNLIPDELPSNRISLAQKAWDSLVKKNINLTVDYFNTLIQCYIENKAKLSYKTFLSSMTCKPNIQTYNLLLECVCEFGDLDQAVEIVNLMKEKELPVTEPVFASLIVCHLKNKDIKSAQNTLETLRITHIKPTSITYTALLRGYAENNENYLFKKVLEETKVNRINIQQIISILYSICVTNNLKLLPLIKNTFAVKTDSRVFQTNLNNLCIHLIYLKKQLVAYELFKCLTEPEIGFLTESDAYGSFLIQELIKSKSPSDVIIKITDDLNNSNRNNFALFKATEFALRIPDVELSLNLLQALFDRKNILRTHYFWPILIQEGRMKGEKGIFEIFEQMLEMNLKIDSETLEVYSLQYINNLDPYIIINKLKNFSLNVTDVLTPLSIVLLRNNKVEDTAKLISKYDVKLDGKKLIKQLATTFAATNDIKNVLKILQNLLSKNHSEDWAGQLIFFILSRHENNLKYNSVLNLLKGYKDNNISISTLFMDKIDYICRSTVPKSLKSTIQRILHSLDTINDLNHNNHIPHPRDMNLEELECHLIELREKQMETRGILRKLIQMHCRTGNVTRVLELVKDFESAGYNITPGMKSSILDMFLKTEQFENAWKTYNELKTNHPGFKIDDFKIIDMAKLLIDHDKFTDALSLLQNFKTNRKKLDKNPIEHNCWKLLDSAANSGNVNETKVLFETVVENGFCSESNTILGPLIRVHIINENKEEAAKEYINCCLKYKKTPLLHELLCFLVKSKTASELIEKVVDATVNVHGAPQTQTTLAAALAECGLSKTLRRLFLESNFYLVPKLLEQHCQLWVKEDKVYALKNFIAGARGISSIDLNPVYSNLLRYYCYANDYENTLRLWNEIQEENVLYSEDLKQLVDNLIKHQNNNEIIVNK